MTKVTEWLKKEKMLIDIQTDNFKFILTTPQWSLVLLLVYILWQVIK